MKTCNTCSIPLTSTRQKYCPECKVISRRAIALASHNRTRGGRKLSDLPEDTAKRIREQRRDSHLKRTYGITLDQYQKLLEGQNFRCAICDKHQDDERTSLHVDHDHSTGEIRGLLCNYCNRRLVGRHRDGVLLRKLADYVEQGTGWYVPAKRPKKRRRTKAKA